MGIDSDLLHKLPPEVARQLSQRAIVSAAADSASRGAGGTSSVDLLRRTTSRNSAQGQPAPEGYFRAPPPDDHTLGRNLSVNTSTNRRVSKTPSSLATNNEGWRFTEDDVASQNTWRGQKEGEAPFKGLNYKGSPPPKPDPAGLKYATQESYREYREVQEAGGEEQALEWTVHQHTRPITDSEAAEMYHKSMDWKHRNALRCALYLHMHWVKALASRQCCSYANVHHHLGSQAILLEHLNHLLAVRRLRRFVIVTAMCHSCLDLQSPGPHVAYCRLLLPANSLPLNCKLYCCTITALRRCITLRHSTMVL